MQRVLKEINRNKEVLTREVIIKAVKGKSSTRKIFWGIVLCVLSLGAFEISIAGIALGSIVVALIALPLGVLMIFFAVKNFRASKRNKENLLKGNYRIVKSVCTKVIDRSTDEGPTYIMMFANGERYKVVSPLGVEGDPFYIVYLEGAKKANGYFSGIRYHPAPDLIIEEN